VRRDFLSVDLLRQYADVLSQEATRLREQADKVEASGRNEIFVDGVRKFPNGFGEVQGFINNVGKAMLDAGIR
jgi:hypothetical protein